MKVRIEIPEWNDKISKSNNPWVSRILANLTPIAQIDSVIYVKYSGPKDKKKAVFNAFKKYTPELNAFMVNFGGAYIQASKDLDMVKLSWLELLIEKYQPKGIQFSIK